MSGTNGNLGSVLIRVGAVLEKRQEERKLKKHLVVRVKETQMSLSTAILRIVMVSYQVL